MKKEDFHSLLFIIVCIILFLGLWKIHEWDKKQYGEMMYQWGISDGNGDVNVDRGLERLKPRHYPRKQEKNVR